VVVELNEEEENCGASFFKRFPFLSKMKTILLLSETTSFPHPSRQIPEGIGRSTNGIARKKFHLKSKTCTEEFRQSVINISTSFAAIA